LTIEGSGATLATFPAPSGNAIETLADCRGGRDAFSTTALDRVRIVLEQSLTALQGGGS
jgi:hypothetical protein